MEDLFMWSSSLFAMLWCLGCGEVEFAGSTFNLNIVTVTAKLLSVHDHIKRECDIEETEKKQKS